MCIVNVYTHFTFFLHTNKYVIASIRMCRAYCYYKIKMLMYWLTERHYLRPRNFTFPASFITSRLTVTTKCSWIDYCSVQCSIHNAISLPAFLLGLFHVLTERWPISHLSSFAHTSLRTESLRPNLNGMSLHLPAAVLCWVQIWVQNWQTQHGAAMILQTSITRGPFNSSFPEFCGAYDVGTLWQDPLYINRIRG
jgi:hypothetical protein